MSTEKNLPHFVGLGAALRRRVDSWYNLLTGIGTTRDRRESTYLGKRAPLSEAQLDAMYASATGRMLVNLVPSEAFRQGYTLTSEKDPEGAVELQKQLQKHDFLRKFSEAVTYGRLYGRGALYMHTRGDPVKPWTDTPDGEILSIEAIPKRRLDIVDYRTDRSSPDYGEIASFRISPKYTAFGSSDWVGELRADTTRMIVLGCGFSTENERDDHDDADVPILETLYQDIRDFESAWSQVLYMLTDANVGIFKFRGLADMLASKSGDTVKTRVEALDLGRSVARSILIDQNDDFNFVSRQFSGVADLLDRSAAKLSSVSKIPISVLMGRSPAGLNATGEADVRLFYDRVQAERENEYREPMLRVAKLFAAGMGTPIDDLCLEFPSLWQETPVEAAGRRKTNADADVAYVREGILLPEEVALSRFRENGEYSDRIDLLDREMREKATYDDPEEEETEPGAAPGADPEGEQPSDPGIAPGDPEDLGDDPGEDNPGDLPLGEPEDG